MRRNARKLIAAAALLLLVPAVAFAVTPGPGRWTGRDNRHKAVGFQVIPAGVGGCRVDSRQRPCVTLFHLYVKIKCPAPYRGGAGFGVVGGETLHAMKRVSKSRFKIKTRSSLPRITVTGKFKSRSKAGGKIGLGWRCKRQGRRPLVKKKSVRWTAKVAPARPR